MVVFDSLGVLPKTAGAVEEENRSIASLQPVLWLTAGEGQHGTFRQAIRVGNARNALHLASIAKTLAISKRRLLSLFIFALAMEFSPKPVASASNCDSASARRSILSEMPAFERPRQRITC